MSTLHGAREFSVILTEGEYRALANAINERLDDLYLPRSIPERNALDRAWSQVQGGWRRSELYVR